MKQKPTVEELRKLLILDTKTGKLYWKYRAHAEKWSARYAGKEAFTTLSDKGYITGRINNKLYKRSVIVYALFFGEWPTDTVDHINRVKTDDNPCNLRLATASQQQQNQENSHGLSNYKGVAWDRNRQKWIAQISVDGLHKNLGRFSSELEAAKAYDIAAKQLHKEFAVLNFKE